MQGIDKIHEKVRRVWWIHARVNGRELCLIYLLDSTPNNFIPWILYKLFKCYSCWKLFKFYADVFVCMCIGDWDEKKIDSITLTAENSKVYLKQFNFTIGLIYVITPFFINNSLFDFIPNIVWLKSWKTTSKNCLIHYLTRQANTSQPNRTTRARCEIYSKFTIKTPDRRQWRRSGVFIVTFEHISHLVLVFLLWTLSM